MAFDRDNKISNRNFKPNRVTNVMCFNKIKQIAFNKCLCITKKNKEDFLEKIIKDNSNEEVK